jgi:hypothetical protein
MQKLADTRKARSPLDYWMAVCAILLVAVVVYAVFTAT